MLLVIIGIVLLVIGTVSRNVNHPFHRVSLGFRLGGVAFVVIGLLTKLFAQIEPGEAGVQVLFGKVEDTVLESGLHVINPLTEITRVDVRTNNYTMSAVHEEGDKTGDDAIRVLSADGLEVVIDMTVLYRLIPAKAPQILQTIGLDYKNVVIRPISRTRARDMAANYDAVSLYSTKRDEFQARITKLIEDDLKKRGFVLEQLLIRNINLPATVKQAIEQKINAEQESQKMIFVLTKEKQEADRKRVEAQGIADYQKIINSEISDKLLQYEQIKAQKELAQSPNAKIIVMGKGSANILVGDK